MASGGLFIGWGEIVTGREQQAVQVFNEFIEHFTGLQQQGEIDSIEPIGLEPHGGDLYGFFLVRGDQDKLSQLRYADEFVHLAQRAGAVVHHFGVVTAFPPEVFGRQVQSFGENIRDLLGGQ